MGYECVRKEQLTHYLFGAESTDVLDYEIFTTALYKLDGRCNCHFDVLGQEVFCNYISPIGQTEWMQDLETFNIHLHDRKAGLIEILIGDDAVGKLLITEYKLLDTGHVAVEIKLGWTVMDKNPISHAHKSTALFLTTLKTQKCLTYEHSIHLEF